MVLLSYYFSRCKLCNIAYSNTGVLEEHIAIKHLGYQNGKEWRAVRKDIKIRQAAKDHEAYEYIRHWADKDPITNE